MRSILTIILQIIQSRIIINDYEISQPGKVTSQITTEQCDDW